MKVNRKLTSQYGEGFIRIKNNYLTSPSSIVFQKNKAKKIKNSTIYNLSHKLKRIKPYKMA